MLAKVLKKCSVARVPRLASAGLGERLRRWRVLMAAIAAVTVLGMSGSAAQASVRVRYFTPGYHIDHYPYYGSWYCWHGHCHDHLLGYYDVYPSLYAYPYLW